MNKLHVKTGDTVVVISGAGAPHKGKDGKKVYTIAKVMAAQPKKGTIVVEGVNKRVHHEKARKQGQAGGLISREAPIDASNVMLYCAKCKMSTKQAYQVTGEGDKKRRVRVCKRCKTDLG